MTAEPLARTIGGMSSRSDRANASQADAAGSPDALSASATGATLWVGSGGDGVAMALVAAMAGGTAGDANDVSCSGGSCSAWGWKLVAVGGDRRATASACAARVGAAEVGSIRELPQDVQREGTRLPVGVHLIVGRDMPGPADLDALLEGDAIVIGTAPLPASTLEGQRLGERAARLRTVALFRWSDAMRTAQSLIEEFLTEGAPSSVSMRMRCADDELGLRGVDAMLLDACDLALEFVPSVESVSAIGRSPATMTDVRVLSAIGRGTDGGVVSIDIADVGGWERSVELTGPGGRLVVNDSVALRWNRAGVLLERMDLAGPTECIGAIIESMRTLARTRGSRESSPRQVSRLAFADATRLSVRTGNAESPASVEELAARP